MVYATKIVFKSNKSDRSNITNAKTFTEAAQSTLDGLALTEHSDVKYILVWKVLHDGGNKPRYSAVRTYRLTLAQNLKYWLVTSCDVA